MEVWKTRPGLEATLMRTVNYNRRIPQERLESLMRFYLNQRYDFWKITDEARESAASAIQDVFITKKINIENAYKRLHFSKLYSIDYDLFITIFQKTISQ